MICAPERPYNMKKKVNEKEGSKKYKNEREDKIKGL
jgi:hypothetical protein